MAIKEKDKAIRFGINLLLSILLTALLYLAPKPVQILLSFLENAAYDFQLRQNYKPLGKDPPVVIVDIDDKSLAKIGRWPWPRQVIANVVEKLFQNGAKVIAFDIIFPEKQPNIAEQFATQIRNDEALQKAVQGQESSFDFDVQFAKSLSMGNTVLGFVLKKEGGSVNILPAPLMNLPDKESLKHLLVPNLPAYLGNIAQLQQAATGGGFINSAPDRDGVIRYSPLILFHDQGIYPSLSLEATRLYLGEKESQLILGQYGGAEELEGVKIGKIKIPTDIAGRILIPFRGPAYTFPYLSAGDVLSEPNLNQMLKDKIVFIGSSATAIGDIISTSISPSYAGVEVHANIATGIIQNYLPYRPVWGAGLCVALVFSLGVLGAFLLPFLGALGATLYTIAISVLLFFTSKYFWVTEGIVLPVMYPIFSVSIVYIGDLIAAYLFESKRRKEIKSVFGQYVPPDYIDSMLAKGGDFAIHGQTKELSVLFADIRNFTKMSEQMTAEKITEFLNLYLTPMTQIIFDTKGTVDKYVGDLIMAFWGAPLENPQHAHDAISAALTMHRKLRELNQNFQQMNFPTVEISIGLNSGSMNVGDMGSKFRRAYTVIGDAVNLASRLEGVSKFYHVRIAVGQETFDRTKQDFLYRKLDRVKVLGRAASIDVYEPLCTTQEKTQDKEELIALHERSLQSYFQKDWEAAEKGFLELREKDQEEQGLYELYLERISHYKSSPPPENWDGTFVFESK